MYINPFAHAAPDPVARRGSTSSHFAATPTAAARSGQSLPGPARLASAAISELDRRSVEDRLRASAGEAAAVNGLSSPAHAARPHSHDHHRRSGSAPATDAARGASLSSASGRPPSGDRSRWSWSHPAEQNGAAVAAEQSGAASAAASSGRFPAALNSFDEDLATQPTVRQLREEAGMSFGENGWLAPPQVCMCPPVTVDVWARFAHCVVDVQSSPQHAPHSARGAPLCAVVVGACRAGVELGCDSSRSATDWVLGLQRPPRARTPEPSRCMPTTSSGAWPGVALPQSTRSTRQTIDSDDSHFQPPAPRPPSRPSLDDVVQNASALAAARLARCAGGAEPLRQTSSTTSTDATTVTPRRPQTRASMQSSLPDPVRHVLHTSRMSPAQCFTHQRACGVLQQSRQECSGA